MIKYTITSGTPTTEELRALEIALAHHKKVESEADNANVAITSRWAKPILRSAFDRKN